MSNNKIQSHTPVDASPIKGEDSQHEKLVRVKIMTQSADNTVATAEFLADAQGDFDNSIALALLMQIAKNQADSSTRMESKLDFLSSEIMQLRTDFTNLDKKVTRIQVDLDLLKTDVSQLKFDVSILKSDVSILKEDVSILKEDVSILRELYTF